MEIPGRIHVIACGVLAIDLKAVVKQLELEVSMEFLPGGLHNTPHDLRRRLQECIDAVSATHEIDRIALGYGLCGRGTVGLHARGIPLAVPRVHDCLALFLGSDAVYHEQFAKYPGTYYIAAGWVEEKVRPKSMEATPGDKVMPLAPDFDEMVEKYDREKAEAIRDFFNSWQRNYQRAVFIDTGMGGQREKYAEIARAMAKEFGWLYEELPGTSELLEKLLTTERSTDDILIVPPHHATTYDAVGTRLKAVPVWQSDSIDRGRPYTLTFDDADVAPAAAPDARLGLGIDAGGTYTDAVIYDFQTHCVLRKAKALTTRWDFTIGINEALDQLDREQLKRVDLVSISTTLATNAIVEDRGQKVGLLIMPPYGLFDLSDIAHRPIAVIDGKMEIDGHEIAPINPDQLRQVAREMVEKNHVRAFAITGYASCINPSHELQARALVRQETGLSITCGHEVSESLNYRIRAQTAALNARIIPYLEAFLDSAQASLHQRGIHALLMVVKSDGSLTNMQTARQRPIETMLSGPAASVAGARYLAHAANAIVVDIGGTTTDTAVIENGTVQTCKEGASIGGWRTHVQALDMRTLGLGGDSLIALENRKLRIGPRRVAPLSWLASHQPHSMKALDWLEHHLDYFDISTKPMDIIALNGHSRRNGLTGDDAHLFELLKGRPHSLHELACRVNGDAWRPVPLEHLEEQHLIQRCGLTPTDLLHAAGRMTLWDATAARRGCDIFRRLLGMASDKFVDHMTQRVIQRLALELLKTQLAGEIDPDGLAESPAAVALLNNLFASGGSGLRVRVALQRPVIGVGAPARFFLPQAAAILETEAIIPPDADVANAIGAITSSVIIHKQIHITPNDAGRYTLSGLPDAPVFVDFDEAHACAIEQLQKIVRHAARRAGASQTRVEITVEDHIGAAADGAGIFLGRTLEARLSGAPDLAALTASS